MAILGACGDSGASSSGDSTDTGETGAGGTADGGTEDGGTGGSGDDGATGTDGGEAPPPVFESGDRLKAVYQDGGGGAERLSHWYDTELGMECEFMVDENWEFRCMPIVGINLVYLDANCTEPAQKQTEWCTGEPPTYVVDSFERRCVGPRRVQPYRLGESTQVTEVYGGEACTRQDLSEPTTYHRLEEVDLATFVAASVEHVTLDSGLGVRVLETEGGASERIQVISTSVDQVCGQVTVRVDGGVANYCLHGDPAYDFDRFFADETCGSNVVAYSIGASECDPPAMVRRYELGTCAEGAEVYEVGSSVDPSNVFEGQGTSCRPPPDNHRFWAIGDPVAVDDLPLLTAAFVGTGDVQVHFRATAKGTPLIPRDSLWRMADGSVCRVQSTPDGLRCLPDHLATAEAQFWADAQCETMPLLQRQDTECEPAPVPTLHVTQTGDNCASMLTDPRAIGAEHDGPVYTGDSGNCTEHSPGVMERFFPIGEPGSAAFTDYPEITKVRDGM